MSDYVITFPNKCCRCLGTPATCIYSVSTGSNLQWTDVLPPLGSTAHESAAISSVDIPLCEHCKQDLSQIEDMRIRATEEMGVFSTVVFLLSFVLIGIGVGVYLLSGAAPAGRIVIGILSAFAGGGLAAGGLGTIAEHLRLRHLLQKSTVIKKSLHEPAKMIRDYNIKFENEQYQTEYDAIVLNFYAPPKEKW